MEKASVREILAKPYKSLPLSPKLKKFLGKVPYDKQFSISVKGKPGSGKSTFVLKYLTEEFSRFGQVLYFTTEEKLFAGSLKERLKRAKVTNRNKVFVSDLYMSTLIKELETGLYHFCVVDSINRIYDDNREMILPREVMKLIGNGSQFPNVSFIFIGHLDALMRRAAGGAASQYDTDILIDCVYDNKTGERYAEIAGGKNRFNDDTERFITKYGKK